MAHAIEYRRLRAPRQSGEALIDPPLCSAAELVAENQAAARVAYPTLQLQGVALEQLRDTARQEVFTAALAYTRQTLGDNAVLPAQAKGTFVLAGHQPELFHPGVWFKNFVLSALGQKLNATAINLIVDNDKAHAPSVRVPQLINGQPRVETIWFDDPLTERPYEERAIVNEARFEGFPSAVDPQRERLVTSLWQLAPRDKGNAGERLAAARHRLEYQHGLRTLEVPLSAVCATPTFARFALHLLLKLPRLREIYNRALAEYRQANGVRSEAHPVPELAQQGDWLEAPLWIWSSERPQRRQAYVRKTPEKLLISDRDALQVEIPLADGQPTEASIAAWQASATQVIKLRSRALITTMYARLLLSDLFLHGIGGAKYDQLTDAIIEQFFGLAPPHFMTVTATLKLHDYDAAHTAKMLHRVEHQLRELPYHPEAFGAGPEVAALRQEKLRLIMDPPPKGHRKAWHDAIVRVNAQLLPFTHDAQQALLRERGALVEQLQLHTLHGSREFSFCLFEESLIEQLKQMAT